MCYVHVYFFFFKQKTAYEMRISDWSSDVCSSDLLAYAIAFFLRYGLEYGRVAPKKNKAYLAGLDCSEIAALARAFVHERLESRLRPALLTRLDRHRAAGHRIALLTGTPDFIARSEEHTSELQSLMRTSYAVFCL